MGMTAIFPTNTAALQLEAAVVGFCSLERDAPTLPPHELYHAALAHIHDICAAVVACENAGLAREEILEVLEPAREIHARSPFVNRLQTWPRGYPGDFETVEYIMSGENRAEEGTLQHACESYSLNFPIAQQHRNKVRHQTLRLLNAMMRRPGHSRILSLACGSAPDFASIEPLLAPIAGEIWLNDADEDALEHTSRVLRSVHSHCHIVAGNALKIARRLPGPFDLVLAGGLFDYLPDRVASFLIGTVYNRLIGQGGTFFFTNIARGNPYRCLIEYMGDWTLIERSEEDILRLCSDANVPAGAVSMRYDETGLALLIDVTRP
jgi:extracellular factor (EF) 3-hydroxypalmitic acid methyl ester biosynthesis protein